MRFSKSTQCFYPRDVEYPVLPADIVDCTQADFDIAMKRASGETLDFVNGAVVIIPAPPRTQAQLDAETSSQAKADLAAACLAALPDILAYIASKPDSPTSLRASAAAAAADRAKVK